MADRMKKDSIENKLYKIKERIRRKIYENSEGDFYFDILHTFKDAVVIQNYEDEKLYEVSYSLVGEELILEEPKEVTEAYVEKRRKDKPISGLIVKKNAEKRLVSSIVLVPNKADSDGDSLTEGQIEEKAHEFMLKYRNIDLMHTLNNTGEVVESFILPFKWEVEAYGTKKTLPLGTWVMTTKVTDDETWEAVKNGDLRGMSIMGVKKTVAVKGKENVSCKRTTLQDLGEDFVITHVSYVDDPAVEDALFFSIKSKEEQKPQSFMEKLKAIITSEKTKSQEEEEKEGDVMTKEEILELVNQVVKSALKADKNTEEQVEEETTTEETTTEETIEEQVEETTEDIEALKAKIDELEKEVKAAKSKAVKSNQIDDGDVQDQSAVKSSRFGRDVFGRRIKKGAM